MARTARSSCGSGPWRFERWISVETSPGQNRLTPIAAGSSERPRVAGEALRDGKFEAHVSIDHPFVGRRIELEALDATRRQTARRRGSITLVGGSAGIGKSRLLAEFRATLGATRALVLRAECLEEGGATFGPIRAWIRALSRPGESSIDALAEAAIERDGFFRSVERVLVDAANRRTVVACIEDLHSADPATLDFLAYLAPHVENERIAVFATYRDDVVDRDLELAESFLRIARAPSTRRVVLRPLPDAEILTLVEGAAGASVPPTGELLRDIVSRAGGNPFYAKELLTSVPDGARSGLPISIRGSVLARFGRLGEEERTILSHAAILGYRFDPDILATVLGIDVMATARALRHARDEHLVVEEPDDPLPFRFVHALTQEAIAAHMLDFEARPLHARVARILESLDDRERRVGEIAYHWWKSRDAARTLSTCEAAGDAAMALYAAGDAASFYERALSVATDRADERRLCVRAAGAAEMHGDFSRAMSSYERALAFELEAREFKRSAELIRRVAACLTYSGRDVEARDRVAAHLSAFRDELPAVDARILDGYPILITLGGGGARGWLERGGASDTADVPDADAWMITFLELNALAYVGDAAGWQERVDRISPGSTGAGGRDAFAISGIAVTSAFLGIDRESARRSIDLAHETLGNVGLGSMSKYVSTSEAFFCYLFGDIRGAQRAAHHGLGDGYDYNQRANVSLVGALIGLDLDDARLLELATDDRMLAAWSGVERSHSTALTATGIAACLVDRGRTDEARAILEKSVLALESLFATQFLLPFAARHIASDAVRRRLDGLLATIYETDRGGCATAAMVRATFAQRDGATDAVDLARLAAARYADLAWPLLQAQALELAGEPVAARDIYLRHGSMQNARRIGRSEAAVELTAREREVAALVTAGHGNGEIALQLGVSVKTVEKHLSRIFERLGIRSRAQVAAHMARETRRASS